MEEDQALECFRGRTEGSSSQRPSLPQVPAWRHQSMTKEPQACALGVLSGAFKGLFSICHSIVGCQAPPDTKTTLHC